MVITMLTSRVIQLNEKHILHSLSIHLDYSPHLDPLTL